MTMVMENQNRQYGSMGYENVYPAHAQPGHSHFSNDTWPSHSSSHPPPMYPASAVSSSNPVPLKREEIPRPPALTVPYSSVPVSAPSSVVSNGHQYSTAAYSAPEVMVVPPELPRTTFEQPQTGATVSPVNSFAPGNYPLDYAPSLPHHQQHQQHHAHQSPVHPDGRALPPGPEPQPPATQQRPAPTYGDALDASRGMVALGQDLTPRTIYGPQVRRESYGFPSTHSSASSISSGANYPYYSASVVSVDSSVTDYSSTSETYDPLHSRTLPRLSGLMAGPIPPGPQSMMGQFSSKMPSNTQKKHKCKICDKRFTRPSSLQTHMYSHTGEKPYACDVEGCGRHFSVVSNLRRHKKVHKNEKESGSPGDES
ncbi:hypothetical protein VTO42DRAFT_540 [Malbranchea cinnamomea]